jgi:hypothetical protein
MSPLAQFVEHWFLMPDIKFRYWWTCFVPAGWTLNNILIWRPIYRQPVYVGIYLLLAPAQSNYRLKTKKTYFKKVSVMNKSLQGRFRHTQQLHIILLCLHVYTNKRWKRTHLGFSPTDLPATSHVKFWRRKQPIFVFICEGG